MSLKHITMEAEGRHKRLLTPALTFNHWDAVEPSAQPAVHQAMGNHPGLNDSLVPDSHKHVLYRPGPKDSLLENKLLSVSYASLNVTELFSQGSSSTLESCGMPHSPQLQMGTLRQRGRKLFDHVHTNHLRTEHGFLHSPITCMSPGIAALHQATLHPFYVEQY